MRAFALASLLALAAGAQPAPADSALVEDVLDALAFDVLDRSPVGSRAAGDALRDTLRARLLADLRPDALRPALAFLRGPVNRAYTERYRATQARLSTAAGLEDYMDAVTDGKKGALADSAAVDRLVRAQRVAELSRHVMEGLFQRIEAELPALAERMRAEAPSPEDELVQASTNAVGEATSALRYTLRGMPAADIHAAAAFYESPAGTHLQSAVNDAMVAVFLPMVFEQMAGMYRALAALEGATIDLDAAAPSEDAAAQGEVDVMPELIGGLGKLQSRVAYPEGARRDGVEGTVVVEFVVDEAGRVTDPVVTQSPDPRLTEAALAAVRASRFTPGRHRGRPVRVRFGLPVTFRLQDARAVPADG